MSRGLGSVTGLTLQVNYELIGAVQNSAPEVLQDGSVRSGVALNPDRFRVVPSSVFAALAAAVPNLQLLGLQGCCWDASLSVFGTSCPRLITLCVQALQVPIRALQGFGNHLPNLTSISIGNAHITREDEEQLGLYLDAFLLETGHCSKLTSLCMSTPDENVGPDCEPEGWSVLPASLQQLDINWPVAYSDVFQTLITRMKVLRLWSHEVPLPDVLQTNPLLESLETLGESDYAVHCTDSPGEQPMQHLMKQRLLDGTFHLACHALSLHGTAKDIRDMLEWFPQIPSCKSLSIYFEGGWKADCLQHVPRLFQGMSCFIMGGVVVEEQSSDRDLAFFSPLTDCPNLTKLCIQCNLPRLTTSGWVQLCVSLQGLQSLGLNHHTRVDTKQIEARCRTLGRKVRILRYAV